MFAAISAALEARDVIPPLKIEINSGGQRNRPAGKEKEIELNC